MKDFLNTLKSFYSTFKEELTALPLLILGLLMFRSYLASHFPETAQYDLLSETESIVWTVIKLLIFTSCSWFGIRIVHPPMYQALKEYYHGFGNMSAPRRLEAARNAFLVILFSLIVLSSFGQNYQIELHNGSKDTVFQAYEYEIIPGTNCIKVDGQDKYCGQMCISPIIKTEAQLRSELTQLLHAQLYVREATNNNDGIEVEKYLASVGLGKGYAWCAAFTSWNLNYLQVPNPMSAWSPDWAKAQDRIWSASMVKQNKVTQSPSPGDCFTIYYSSKQRVGHVGFIVSDDGTYFTTIEGNTNIDGSRLGIGVFKLKRQKSKVYAVTNYITPYSKHYENKGTNINIYCTHSSSNDELMQMQQDFFISGDYYSREGYSDNHLPGERYCDILSSRYSPLEIAFVGRFWWNKGCKQKPIEWESFSDSRGQGWYFDSDSLLRFAGGKNQAQRQTNSRAEKQREDYCGDYSCREEVYTSILQNDDSSWRHYDIGSSGLYHLSNNYQA